MAVSFPRPSRTGPTAHCQLAFDFAERLAATLSPLLSDSGTPRLPIESLHTALREWGIPTRSNSPTHSHPRHLSPPTRILTLAIDTSTYTRPLAFRLPNSILHTSMAHPHTHTPAQPHPHIPTSPQTHTTTHFTSPISHPSPLTSSTGSTPATHLSSLISHLSQLGRPPRTSPPWGCHPRGGPRVRCPYRRPPGPSSAPLSPLSSLHTPHSSLPCLYPRLGMCNPPPDRTPWGGACGWPPTWGVEVQGPWTKGGWSRCVRGAGKSANFCEVSDTSLRNRKICKIAERPRHVEGCVGSPHCGLWPRARGVAGHEGLGVAEGEFTKG